MDNKKQLVFSILEFFQSCVEDGTIKSEEVESLEVATQCIGEVFGVDISNGTQKKELSIKPATLSQIFSVFLKTQKKAQQSASSGSTEEKIKTVTESDRKKAEELKSAGNLKVTEKNYKEAVKLYTQAIELVADNAVYYANRAAAYSQLNEQDNAIADSLRSSEIDPLYAKAYSRLGHAYYLKGDYAAATKAYSKANEMEPNNANIKTMLENCRSRDSANSLTESTRSSGIPANNGQMPGADAMGGMDIAGLMANPMIRNMANQFMQSGAMNDMMRDPSKMMEMAKQFMGGNAPSADSGADPLASLMNNPEMARLAQQFANSGGINGNNPSDAGKKE